MRTFGISKAKNCWLVRLAYKDKMPQVQKVFCWGSHRTETKAFFEAVDFRNAEIKRLTDAGHVGIGKRNLSSPQSNNNSGILGVHRVENKNKLNKPLGTFSWTTTFSGGDGKAVTKRFSENKYGAIEAFKMACYERSEALDIDISKIFIIENVKIPEWP